MRQIISDYGIIVPTTMLKFSSVKKKNLGIYWFTHFTKDKKTGATTLCFFILL